MLLFAETTGALMKTGTSEKFELNNLRFSWLSSTTPFHNFALFFCVKFKLEYYRHFSSICSSSF